MKPETSARPAVIHTERLALRPFMAEDEEDMIGILADPAVSRTYMLPDFSSRAEAARLFERLLYLSGAPDHFIYGIYLHNRLIGFLNDVEINGDAIELGYVISPAHWNRGYATEALGACIDALFSLGFETVLAGYFEGNDASRRVMEKCGMRPAGWSERMDYRGEEKNCVYMEIHAAKK